MLSLTGNLNQWEFLKLVAKVAESQDYSDALISGFVSVHFFFASKAKRGIFLHSLAMIESKKLKNLLIQERMLKTFIVWSRLAGVARFFITESPLQSTLLLTICVHDINSWEILCSTVHFCYTCERFNMCSINKRPTRVVANFKKSQSLIWIFPAYTCSCVSYQFKHDKKIVLHNFRSNLCEDTIKQL